MTTKVGKLSILLLFFLVFTSCGSKESNQAKDTEQTPVAKKEEVPKKSDPIILFFGNSITAGYGVDLEQAFPNLIQKRLDSLGYEYKVVNAGLSGETTAGGLNRIEWVLRSVPDIFVLELGGNDGLRGLDLDETRRNLIKIIDIVRAANPDVHIILAGMMVPPNMGPDYASGFQEIYPTVAKEKKVSLIPFILEGVGGDPELNLPDGIHPTPEGHEIVADVVWAELKPYLKKQENL